MNTKQFLALSLGLLTLQASAHTYVKWMEPIVKTYVSNRSFGWLRSADVVEIVIAGVPNFKGDDFEVTFSPDGWTAYITGKSYSWKDCLGRKYRRKFKLMITLPGQVDTYYRGRRFKYNNKSRIFSHYYHHTDNSLVITARAA